MLGSEVCSFGRFDSNIGQALRLLQWLILQALLKKSLTKEATGPGLSGFSAQLEGFIVLKAGKTGSFLKQSGREFLACFLTWPWVSVDSKSLFRLLLRSAYTFC